MQKFNERNRKIHFILPEWSKERFYCKWRVSSTDKVGDMMMNKKRRIKGGFKKKISRTGKYCRMECILVQ